MAGGPVFSKPTSMLPEGMYSQSGPQTMKGSMGCRCQGQRALLAQEGTRMFLWDMGGETLHAAFQCQERDGL